MYITCTRRRDMYSRCAMYCWLLARLGWIRQVGERFPVHEALNHIECSGRLVIWRDMSCTLDHCICEVAARLHVWFGSKRLETPVRGTVQQYRCTDSVGSCTMVQIRRLWREVPHKRQDSFSGGKLRPGEQADYSIARRISST